MKTYFTSGLAIRQRNIVYRSFNHFLILSIQNLNSLHDYLHSGPCPSVSTVQFEPAPVIRNPDTNISTGTMNINPNIIRKSKCSRVSKRKVHFTKRSV